MSGKPNCNAARALSRTFAAVCTGIGYNNFPQRVASGSIADGHCSNNLTNENLKSGYVSYAKLRTAQASVLADDFLLGEKIRSANIDTNSKREKQPMPHFLACVQVFYLNFLSP